MIAFICATPLQVFNAVNIMFHHFPDQKMDIYALNFRVNMRDVLKNCKLSKVINDVVYIDTKLHSKSIIGTIKDYIFTDKSFENLFSSSSYYTDLFTTWVGGYGTLIYDRLRKNNANIKLHFYEEGIGVYIKNIFGYYGKIKTVLNLAKIRCEADYLEDLYLYQPEMMYSEIKYTPVKIGRFEKETGLYKEELKNLFNVSGIADDNKLIYLENYFEPKIFGEIDQIPIIKKIDRNDLRIRLHPITDKLKYTENGIACADTSVPWEFYLAGKNNVKDMILISIYSSAIFSSKLIFDEEPTIIVLGKAISNFLRDSNKYWKNFYPPYFEALVNGVKNMYSDKSKVIVPETLDEFYEMVK